MIAVLCKDLNGNQEIFFASEGRVLKHRTKEIRSEDYIKTKKLTARSCLGYVGDSGEFFEAVSNELTRKIKQGCIPDISFIASKLQTMIIDMGRKEPHLSVERSYGPLKHIFVLGGLDSKKVKLIEILSNGNYSIKPHSLTSKNNIFALVNGSIKEVHIFADRHIRERLNEAKPFDQIAIDLVEVIKSTSKISDDINDRVMIRRLSNKFELEDGNNILNG